MDTSLRARAMHELAGLVAQNHVWRALAFCDIRSKYRHSMLGTLWIVMTTAVTAVSVGVIYGQFFGQDMSRYLPYFTAGLVVWTFMSSVLNEAATTLMAAGNLIKATSVPIGVHIMRMLQRNFIVFLHNLGIVAALWLILPWDLGLAVMTMLAGLAMLYVFLAGAAVTLSFICVRYRDVPPLIAAGTQFLFLASPILWYEESLRFGRELVALNPIAYFMRVVRDPLLGQAVPLATWSVALLLTTASAALAAFVYVSYRDRIAYWV
jgi:lipopolysaccharide transport system permease protein